MSYYQNPILKSKTNDDGSIVSWYELPKPKMAWIPDCYKADILKDMLDFASKENKILLLL